MVGTATCPGNKRNTLPSKLSQMLPVSILSLPENPKQTRDYSSQEELYGSGIAVKEAKALIRTLSTFSNDVCNGRVDAFVDNSNLLDFWNNQGGRSIPLSNEIKELFLLTLDLNIFLNLFYIPPESVMLLTSHLYTIMT